MEPETITFTGRFDSDERSALAQLFELFDETPQKVTIITHSRSILWWRVSLGRLRFEAMRSLNQTDPMTLTVDFQPIQGTLVFTPSPWWERALYYCAWLWSNHAVRPQLRASQL